MRTYDPEKPVYQWTGYPPPGGLWIGGKCYQVQLQTTDDQLRIAEMKRGSDLMFYGVIIAIVCAVVHGIAAGSNIYGKAIQRFAEYGIVGGVLAIVAGLFYKKLTQYENWIILFLAVGVVGFLLYRFRDWSLSHLGRRVKSSKTPTENKEDTGNEQR